MKNLSVVLNVVLLVAVGVLYILFFNARGKAGGSSKLAAHDTASAHKPVRIAYFEMDSIQENTDMVKDVRAEMNKEEEKINATLNQLGKNYQDKRLGYQSRQEKGQMTPDDVNAAMNDLANMEQTITTRKKQLEQGYGEKMTEKNLMMRKMIEEFIAEYNKAGEYTFIVSDDPGLFYYKDSMFNITKDVIKGLNEKYKAQSKN